VYLKLNTREKTLGAGEKLQDFETPFLYKMVVKTRKIFSTILYENEFQNPQVFHQHLRFSPKRSTLDQVYKFQLCEEKLDSIV
jgi:hypothetical protein